MKIVHFCAGLEGWNGMANTARQFVAEELEDGHDSRLANDPDEIAERSMSSTFTAPGCRFSGRPRSARRISAQS